MALLDDLAGLLVDGGFGTTSAPAPTIFTGLWPDSPPELITIIEAGGEEPIRTMDDGPDIERPRVQIVVRRLNYQDASTVAHAVMAMLEGVRNRNIGNTRYISVTPVAPPFLLQQDGSNRTLMACNYQIEMEA